MSGASFRSLGLRVSRDCISKTTKRIRSCGDLAEEENGEEGKKKLRRKCTRQATKQMLSVEKKKREVVSLFFLTSDFIDL